MEISQAKITMAAYLAGRPITDGELAAAHEALRSDPEYCEFLRDELSPTTAEPCLCEVFAERAAEFSELSPAVQTREFPALAAHVAECEACQWLLQQLHTFQEEPSMSTPLSQSAHQPARRRASALHLAADRSGRIRLATPAAGFRETFEEVPATGLLGGAGLLQRPGSAFAGPRRVWTVFDSDRGLEVDFTIAGLERDFELLIRLRPDRGSSRDWRLEITDLDRLSCQAAGPADQFRSSPIVLPPGNWLVVLQHGAASEAEEWEVPLRFEFDEED